jgi:hypothetical protein
MICSILSVDPFLSIIISSGYFPLLLLTYPFKDYPITSLIFSITGKTLLSVTYDLLKYYWKLSLIVALKAVTTRDLFPSFPV